MSLVDFVDLVCVFIIVCFACLAGRVVFRWYESCQQQRLYYLLDRLEDCHLPTWTITGEDSGAESLSIFQLRKLVEEGFTEDGKAGRVRFTSEGGIRSGPQNN